MKVLIGCELSGIVRDAFIARGHDAMSCDIEPTESPGPHYQGDIMDMLKRGNTWDLIILHPPCTALCVSGNSTYANSQARADAVKWTRTLWRRAKRCAKYVALENPQGVLRTMGGLPAAQFVQPYHFGHKEQKKTGLHLHNLPPLEYHKNWKRTYRAMMRLPKNKRERLHYLSPSSDRGKIRSMTYPGIANAFAHQWGSL